MTTATHTERQEAAATIGTTLTLFATFLLILL